MLVRLQCRKQIKLTLRLTLPAVLKLKTLGIIMYYSNLAAQQDISTKILTNNRVKKLTVAINTALLASSLTITVTALAQVSETAPQTLKDNSQNTANQLTQAIQVKIAAGSLSQVLSQFSGTIGVALSFDANLLAGKKSAGIKGKYSSQQKSAELGFNKLLVSSGFHISYLGNNNYKLVADNIIGTLATTQVIGYQETAISPIRGYVASSSATGTKTDTPLIEIAQSISVIGSKEIQAYGAQSVMETLAYTAGVTNSSGFNPSKEVPMMRGFSQYGGILRDGLNYGGAWGTRQETFGLERVEFLKGASSVLYGMQTPGGVINAVSKRPQYEMINQVGIELGNYDRKQLTVDIGGDITGSSEFLWRFTGLTRQADSQVDFVEDSRDYLAPSFTWHISEKTELTVLGLYQKSDTIFIMGLPQKGTLLDNPAGKIPKNRFLGDPNWESGETTTKGVTIDFTHQITDNLVFSNTSRWQNNETLWQLSWNNGFIEDSDRIVSRGGYARIDDDTVIATDFNLTFTLNQGAITHRFLLGVDYSEIHYLDPTYLGDNLKFSNIDVFNPVYTPVDFSEATYTEYSSDKTIHKGIYLQDQIKIGKHWRFNIGTRFAKASDENLIASTKSSDEQWVGNAGIVYLADNGLAPFVSYSQSFEAEYQDTIDGRTKPSKGDQMELGLRWQPMSQDVFLSASIYQLTKSNVPKSLKGVDYVEQIGEVESKGFEFEAKGRLTESLEFSSAYAYTDARTTQSTNTNEIGLRTADVPYHQASLWLDHSFANVGIEDLNVGLGIRYLSEKTIDAADYSVPASTQFDARASYQLTDWQMVLTVNNITDEDDFSQCTWGDCSDTKARTITAKVSYSF
jgi:iron complex outermembrane receptor protein